MQGTICAWANYAQADRGRDRQGQRADRVKRKGRAGALQDVPLGQKDGSWSFPHSIRSRSVADAPRPDEILVVMGIADGGRLSNDCGTEPILQAEIRSRSQANVPCLLQTGFYADEEDRHASTLPSKFFMFTGLAI